MKTINILDERVLHGINSVFGATEENICVHKALAIETKWTKKKTVKDKGCWWDIGHHQVTNYSCKLESLKGVGTEKYMKKYLKFFQFWWKSEIYRFRKLSET